MDGKKDPTPAKEQWYILVYSYWHSRLPSGSLAYAITMEELHRAKAIYMAKYPDLQEAGWVIYGRTPGTMRMADNDTFQKIPG